MVRREWVLSLLLLVAVCSAQALVNIGNPGGNTTAPTGQDGQPSDPGFGRMMQVRGGTGIYLGNGWVLTARHIDPKWVVLEGQRRGQEEAVETVHPFKQAELKLFRLKEGLWPDFPPLKIASSTPKIGTPVVMIGTGGTCREQLSYWQVDRSTRPWTWTPVESSELGNAAGLLLKGGDVTSWGTNRISSLSENERIGALLVTNFSANPVQRTPFEAQAVSRDTGGAVFVETEEGWQLTGVIVTVGRLLPGQPEVKKPETGGLIVGSAIFGNLTLSVNLAPYRHEILQVTGLGES